MLAVDAPAKVNLSLRVLERGDDGYHDLVTTFCALELGDRVEVEVQDDGPVTVDVAGPDVGPPEQNLAVRAAEAFRAAVGATPGVRIRIEKRIPPGGGLGGGSSDAAATLIALDRLLPGRLRPGQLAALGAGLGSDVAFFLSGHGLALGTGRGDRVTPLPPLPARPALLVLPPFGVATAEAYRWLDDDRAAASLRDGPPPEPPARPGTAHDWAALERAAVNDFEPPVFRRHPRLRLLRDALRSHGARLALLAGSGSSVFGLFADPDTARAAQAALTEDQPDCRVVLSRTRSN